MILTEEDRSIQRASKQTNVLIVFMDLEQAINFTAVAIEEMEE